MDLGYITRLDEVRGLVPDDPGEIVRHAQPLDEAASQQIREQQIARMSRDDAAISAREARIARRGAVTPFRRRA